jgi:CubicO group peptidase (beta-lactamase class C family)
MKSQSVTRIIRQTLILNILCALLFTTPSEVSARTSVIGESGKLLSANTSPGLSDATDLEAFLDGIMAVQLETYHIAGSTVLVVRDGEILFSKGYGYANVATGVPVDPATTLFRIGSVTKLFTWTAVMQLAEQGVLDLDADMNTYLDFEIPTTYPEPITLKNLMSHTAGFEEMGFGMFATSPDAMVSNEQWLKTHIPARVQNPGEFSAYSNYGAALAGYIVERMSGMPYEDYINRNILTPLGMATTTAKQPLAGDQILKMSLGYVYAGGAFVAKDFELVNAAPAGSISAPATDIANFMIAHLNGGEYAGSRILDEASINLMHSQLWHADDRLNGWAYGFYEMNQNGYRVIGHGGDTQLFHSLLALIPDENVGVFVSYNTKTNSMAPQKLFELFMDRYYPGIPIETVAPPTDTVSRARQVTGSYRVNRSVYTRAGKIDSLLQPIVVQASTDGILTIPTPIGTMRFIEVSPYYYQQIGGNESVVFRVDQSGKVTHSFLNSFPMMAVERLPWYNAGIFHLALLLVSLLLSLSMLATTLVRLCAPRGAFDPKIQPRQARAARWILNITAALCLLFAVFYAISLSNSMLRLTGQRMILDILSWIALWIAILSLISTVLAAIAWSKGYWRLSGRIHYTLVTLGTVIFSVLMIVYHQIGWQW